MQNIPIRVLNRYQVTFIGIGNSLGHVGRETHSGWEHSAMPQPRETPPAIHPPVEGGHSRTAAPEMRNPCTRGALKGFACRARGRNSNPRDLVVRLVSGSASALDKPLTTGLGAARGPDHGPSAPHLPQIPPPLLSYGLPESVAASPTQRTASESLPNLGRTGQRNRPPLHPPRARALSWLHATCAVQASRSVRCTDRS